MDRWLSRLLKESYYFYGVVLKFKVRTVTANLGLVAQLLFFRIRNAETGYVH